MRVWVGPLHTAVSPVGGPWAPLSAVWQLEVARQMRVWLTLLGRGKAADWRVGTQVCFRGRGSVTDGVREQRLQSPAVPRALLESLRLWSLWAQGGRRARRREEPETQARLSGSRLQGFFFFFFY